MSDEPAGSASQASGRSWLRILLVVVVVLGLLVGLYAWAGFKLAPRLVTRNATEYVREHYGRELVLRDVQFNPFTLELRIGEMVLPDKDGSPMLSWRQLLVDFAGWRSLTRRAFAFEHIQLSQPRIDVVHRADGNWNLLDLIPPSTEPAPGTAPKPPRLIVDAFDLVQGAGSFTDRLQGAETEQVTDLNFSLRDFSTLVSGNHFDLRAASPNIESIRLEGNFSLEPLASSGRVEIGGLSLPRVQKTWLRDSRPVVETGALEFAGDYQLAVPQGPLEFKAQVGRLQATDLALLADGATESWVRIPSLTVSDTAFDLAAQQVKVGAVVIDQPAVTAVLDADANLNLLAYVPAEEAPAAGAAPAGSAAPSPTWSVEIGSVAMNAAAVDFTSHVEVAEPIHWRIAPLEVSTGAIVLPAKAPIELRATGSIDPSGKFSLAGTHDLDSGISKLDLDASGLDLPMLQPVFDQQTQVSIRKGQASAKGQLVIGGPASVTFAGTAAVDNLRVADRLNDTDLVRWRKMTATGIDLQLEPLKASVRDLLLQQPYAQLVIEPNGTTNIGVALSPPGTMPPADQPLPEGEEDEPDVKQEARAAGIAPPPAAPDEAAPVAEGAAAPEGEALPFDIGKVRIVDGSMNFTDRTLNPQFSTGILAMNGTITGLSGKPGSVADVTIDGSVDRYAPVTIRGNVNYFAATTLTDLHMKFSNLEMTTFSPYSGKFAGYRIEKGKLNLETDYRIVDAQLDARHHIVIDQLQLGDRVESKEAVSLPLKLAVALLKDSNGVIDLDIPVTGSLDDPKFRVGPIVWKMVKNLLVKVATSPFKFIGSLFGGDGEEMQYIDFAPGRSTLDEGDLKKLEALRKALVDRPGLSLDIPMALDPALDTPALADAHWQSMLDAAAKERFGDKAQAPGFIDTLATEPKDRRKLMVTAYRTQFGKDPQWPKPDRKDPAQKDRDPDELAAEWVEQQLKPTVKVGDGDLQALGQARAGAIQDELLKDGGVDPARVFIIIQKDVPEAPPAQAEPVATGEPAAAQAAAPVAAPAAGGQVRAQLSLK